METSDFSNLVFHLGKCVFFRVKNHRRIPPTVPNLIEEASIVQLLRKFFRVLKPLTNFLVFHFKEIEALFHVPDFIDKHRADVFLVQVNIQESFSAIGDRVTVLVFQLFDSVFVVLEEERDMVCTVESDLFHRGELFVFCQFCALDFAPDVVEVRDFELVGNSLFVLLAVENAGEDLELSDGLE